MDAGNRVASTAITLTSACSHRAQLVQIRLLRKQKRNMEKGGACPKRQPLHTDKSRTHKNVENATATHAKLCGKTWTHHREAVAQLQREEEKSRAFSLHGMHFHGANQHNQTSCGCGSAQTVRTEDKCPEHNHHLFLRQANVATMSFERSQH